jgi:predicted membrane protein
LDNSNIKIGTNKSFGIVFFVFFLIVSIFPLLNDGDIRVWSLIISLIFLILGILNSKILTPLNQIWFKFGILLGRFVSPVVMGIIFFAIVTPTSLIMRVLQKNLLNLKKGNKKTYWIERSKIKSKMKNQF